MEFIHRNKQLCCCFVLSPLRKVSLFSSFFVVWATSEQLEVLNAVDPKEERLRERCSCLLRVSSLCATREEGASVAARHKKLLQWLICSRRISGTMRCNNQPSHSFDIFLIQDKKGVTSDDEMMNTAYRRSPLLLFRRRQSAPFLFILSQYSSILFYFCIFSVIISRLVSFSLPNSTLVAVWSIQFADWKQSLPQFAHHLSYWQFLQASLAATLRRLTSLPWQRLESSFAALPGNLLLLCYF